MIEVNCLSALAYSDAGEGGEQVAEALRRIFQGFTPASRHSQVK
jgi:hypothetical protein